MVQVRSRVPQQLARPLLRLRLADADGADGGVHAPHEGGVLAGVPSVRLGLAVAHLPTPVDLVADAPVADPVRVGVPVLGPQPGVVGVPAVVRVLHPAHRLVDVARAVRQVGLRPDLGAPGQELVGAEAVRLLRPPGQLQPARPPVAPADPVLPVVGRGEVPARPAHDRHPERPAERDHVAPQTLARTRSGQGERAALVEHPTLDVAEEGRLQEMAVDLVGDPTELGVRLDGDGCGGGRRGRGGGGHGWTAPGAVKVRACCARRRWGEVSLKVERRRGA